MSNKVIMLGNEALTHKMLKWNLLNAFSIAEKVEWRINVRAIMCTDKKRGEVINPSVRHIDYSFAFGGRIALINLTREYLL